METNRSQEVVVGLVVAIGIIIFSVAVMSVGSGRTLFRRQVEYKLHLVNTSGLAVGSPVKLVGVQIGTVAKISLPEDLNQRYIEVTLSVDRRYHERIREDSEAALRILSFLGGEKFIEITPGSTARAVLTPGSRIDVPREGTFEILTERGDDISADMQVISSFFRNTVEDIERGEGFLGQLLANPEFGNETLGDLRATLNSISRIAARLDRGEGLAGRLLTDSEYGQEQSQQIAKALAGINVILESIDRHEGALGDLLDEGGNADKALSDLAVVLSSVKSIFEHLDRGEGLAGRLLKDDEYGERIAANLERLTASLASSTGKIDRGEGSLGVLINDPSVVEGLNNVIYGMENSRIAGGLIRHYREKGEKERQKDLDKMEEQSEEQNAKEDGSNESFR